MAIRDVKLSEIDWDSSVQARLGLDADVVEEYAELMRTGVKMAPVLLFHDGERYYIVDGFHRIDAANDLKKRKIRADVKRGTKEQAAWEALAANKTHGLRRTNGDKHRAVELALKHPTSCDLSNREIAKHVGVSEGLVRIVKDGPGAKLTHLPERVRGGDGKSYPATMQRIQEAPAVAEQEPVPPGPPDPVDDVVELYLALSYADRARFHERIAKEVAA